MEGQFMFMDMLISLASRLTSRHQAELTFQAH
jgi:hypothetical protein